MNFKRKIQEKMPNVVFQFELFGLFPASNSYIQSFVWGAYRVSDKVPIVWILAVVKETFEIATEKQVCSNPSNPI